MKNKLTFLCAAVLFLAVGCASGPGSALNGIKAGMDRSQVENTLGKPKSTSAIDEKVYLNYYFRDGDYPGGGYAAFVRLNDGKVDAIGKLGRAAQQAGN